MLAKKNKLLLMCTISLITFASVFLCCNYAYAASGHYEDKEISVDFSVQEYGSNNTTTTTFEDNSTIKFDAKFKILGNIKRGRKINISWKSVSNGAKISNVPYKLTYHYYPGDSKPYAVSTINNSGVEIEFLENCKNYYGFGGEIYASAMVNANGSKEGPTKGKIELEIAGTKVGTITVDVPQYEKPTGEMNQYQKAERGLLDGTSDTFLWELYINDNNDPVNFDPELHDVLSEGHVIDSDSFWVMIAKYQNAPGGGNQHSTEENPKYYGPDNPQYEYLKQGSLDDLKKEGVVFAVKEDGNGVDIKFPKKLVNQHRILIGYRSVINAPADQGKYSNAISGKNLITGGKYVYENGSETYPVEQVSSAWASMNAKPLGQFTIYKRDFDNHNNPIEGVTFRIWPEGEGPTSANAKEVTTETKTIEGKTVEGVAIFDRLKSGTWCYAEVAGPANVELTDTVGTFTIEPGQNKAKAVIVYNKQRPPEKKSEIVIKKEWHNKNGSKIDPPKGAKATFTIYNNNRPVKDITLPTSDGKWEVTKKFDFSADFKVVEKPIEGWDSEIIKKKTTENGKDIFTFSVVNTSQVENVDIKACKKWVGWNDIDKPKNLYFELCRSADKGKTWEKVEGGLKPVPTENKCVTWKNLPLTDEKQKPYVYKVRELKKVGDKYKEVSEEDGFTTEIKTTYPKVNGKKSNAPEFKVVNTYNKLSSLHIIKRGEDINAETGEHKLLEGARFTLYFKEGNDYIAVGDWKETDKDGVIKFNKLKDGKYKLVENKAPAGYERIDDIYFEIKQENGKKFMRVSDKADADGNRVYRTKGGSEWIGCDDENKCIFELVIEDPSVLQLPQSGSYGRVLIIALGIVITLLGCTYGYKKYKLSN